MRRSSRSVAVSLIGGAALALSTVVSVAAAPPPEANCVATLTSAFGPQGLVDDAVRLVREQAVQMGVPLGALASQVAQTRGTFEECLARVN